MEGLRTPQSHGDGYSATGPTGLEEGRALIIVSIGLY